MEIHLFRHGEVQKHGRFIGITDVPLTSKGKGQNTAVSGTCVQLCVDRVFTSPLQRTFVSGGVPCTFFSEIFFGDWEGMTWEDIQKQYPDAACRYLSDPFAFTFPRGENYYAFRARICSQLRELLSYSYTSVAIVTHLGVIRVLYQVLGQQPSSLSFWDIFLEYGEHITFFVDVDSKRCL